MSQDTQLIGHATPQIDAVAAEHKGWLTGPTDPVQFNSTTPHESLGDQITDGSDYSFWDRRANKQLMYRSVPDMADHTETPMTAINPTPYGAIQRPDGD